MRAKRGLPLLSTATFFNVALYHEVLQVHSGERVSIRRGLLLACVRWRAVIVWSLFSATVRLMIQQLERFGVFGKVGAGALGLGWSVASLFVIPVIVRDEHANPLRMLKISGKLVTETWGKAVYGFVAIHVRFALVVIVFMSFFGGILRVPGALFLAIMAFGGYFVFLGLVNDLYRAALYVCATEGVVPEAYTERDMDRAWRVKRSK